MTTPSDLRKKALGELVDALFTELQHEVSQSPTVLAKVRAACVALGDEYVDAYIVQPWSDDE